MPQSLRGLSSVLAAVGLAGLAACRHAEPAADGGETVPADRVADLADAPAIFTDGAAEAGLGFTHFNGMTGAFYYAEMMGAGAALFDMDGDGDLDALLVQGDHLGEPGSALFPLDGPLGDRLYRNELEPAAEGATLRFTDATAGSGLAGGGYGMGVATGDFDNDGLADVYVTRLGPNALYRNVGGGRFEDVTAESATGERRWSVSAAVLDYDRDGWLDLYVANYLAYTVSADKECTDELGQRSYCGPHAFEPLPDTLYRNRGDGSFEDVSRRAGIAARYGGALGVGVGDFDGDGWLDLYVANDGTPNQLWMSRGDGTFEDRAVLGGCAVNALGHAEASMGVAVADFDGDGDEDLFMTHLTGETNTLYVNDGQGVFDDRSNASGLGQASWGMTGFGTEALDVDLDGRPDVVSVNGAVKVIKELALAGDPFPLHQPNQLFRNVGQGRFEEITPRAGPVFALSEVSRGAALGDLDNDGDTDLLVTNNNGPARLLVRAGTDDTPWLGLRLVTGMPPRDAVGALVGVVLRSGEVRWRRVRTTGSYASSSDPRLTFALADGTEVEAVRVRWPDGAWERFAPPELGSYATLAQGDGDGVAG